jgi:hypothetical protein
MKHSEVRKGVQVKTGDVEIGDSQNLSSLFASAFHPPARPFLGQCSYLHHMKQKPFVNKRQSPKGPRKPGGRVVSELIGPDNYPIGYYNMPKAACTTIKNLLYYMKWGKWHADPLAIHHGIRFKDELLRNREFWSHRQAAKFDLPYMIFTFVREPGRRVYSTFIEKIWATGKYAFPPVHEHLVNAHGYQLPSLESGKFSIEDVRRGFKQFLKFAELNLNGQTPMKPNPHWASQFQRVQKLEAADYTSFIGRVESFATDMSFVLQKAGWSDVSITGKRFNEGPKSPFDFDALIDDEIASHLVRLYANDYLAFGYAPPISLAEASNKVAVAMPSAMPAPKPAAPAPAAIITQKGQVIAGRMDRLGMRLAIILQSWHFARQIGYQTVALWPSREINREQDAERNDMHYPISDFFDIEASQSLIGDNSIIFRDDYFSPKQTFADKDSAFAGQFPAKFDRKRISDLPPTIAVHSRAVGMRFADETADEVRKSCGELFRKLVPAPEVTSAFKDLSTWIGNEPFTAVHIRRGDIMRTVRTLVSEFDPAAEPPASTKRYLNMLRTKLAPLSSIVGILNESKKTPTRVVIFSDCDRTAQSLRSLLKGRDCLCVSDHATPLANDNQRSLAEFLILANSATLIGTQSAFSRTAHFVGKCRFIDASQKLPPRKNMIAVLDELCEDLFATRPDLRVACHALMD